MTRNLTPETFIVGETVAYGRGRGFPRKIVKVLTVNGIAVTVDLDGKEECFKSRRADGKHIRLGEDYYAILPRMIYHPKETTVVEARLRDMKGVMTNLVKKRS